MDKCVALTVLLALSTEIATAGRYFRNDGYDYHHSFERADPHKWNHERSNWKADRGYPHKFAKPRQQESSNEESWQSHHPEGWDSHSNPGSWDSHSQSGSWEYPDFPPHHHHHQPNEWHSHVMSNSNERPSGNWNQGLPHNHQGGHKPNGNHWNQGGNNQAGNWNQGGNSNRPNQNKGESNPNPGTNWQNLPNSNWQNVQGRPNNNNRPRPSLNQATPGNTWGQPTPATPATQAPLAIALCIRSCPVTSEYNPVCGTNNITYGNPGRLDCAKYCGIDVSIRMKQPCPANNTQDFPPQPANNTNFPFQDPTRFTTVDVVATSPGPSDPNLDLITTSKVTISQDVLNSIFTSTPSTSLSGSNTDDDNYDIDIRTRSRNNFPKLI